jgi:alkylation response protein AidB-like acyl-CoA dehydrogenase
MAENFFTDNLDLQRYLKKIDLSEVVGILEDGYRYHEEHDAAPRNYLDAMDNYRLMLEVVGDICANHAAPRAAEADEVGVSCEDGRVVYADATLEAMRFLRQADIVGATLPWEYGGMNLPETILQMVVEIMSRADASLMTVFGLQEIAAKMIAEHGDEEMKARVLPRVISGELVGGAMVLTEPDAGSDLGSVQTRATYDEETGEWRLNGVKRFITNGCSDVLLVLARSEEGSADARGLSFFEAEADETVRIRRTEHKMGLHASPTCEMQFDNTPARLIGKQRFGLIRYAMAMMNVARLAIASQALGIAEAAYREAYQYAQKRVQFGSSIDQIPAVYRMLLSMRAEIEATRALVYETARHVDLLKAYERQKERGELDGEGRKKLKELGRLADVLTPLVKYYATEMGNKVCYQAMQIHGGTGYMREFNVERHYRDVRITNIYEGTSQLQVVAAIGGLLGHALDGLLADYAARDYGADQADLKGQLQEATALFNRCIDHLKEAERVAVDYYGSDAVEVATYLLNGWLVLQDGAASVDAAASDDAAAERKRDLARVYIGEALPQIRARIDVLRAIDPTPVQAKETVLTDEF